MDKSILSFRTAQKKASELNVLTDFSIAVLFLGVCHVCFPEDGAQFHMGNRTDCKLLADSPFKVKFCCLYIKS